MKTDLIAASIGLALIVTLLIYPKSTGPYGGPRPARIENDLMAIVRVAEIFQISCGGFPRNLEQLKSGRCEDGTEIGMSLESVRDPWGREYGYAVSPDGVPRAWCLGRDGAKGGTGVDEDLEIVGGSP